jgi:hypothetical protein
MPRRRFPFMPLRPWPCSRSELSSLPRRKECCRIVCGLDLGWPDAVGRGQLVLDPSDPAGRSLEPDPSAVDLHVDHGSARRMAGASPSGRRSPPHHDPDFLRRAGYRRAVHVASGADHARRCVRSVATLARAVFGAVARGLACPVSLWKNEGKNRSLAPVKGGFGGPDELYDSQPKLTGFPPCLTLKIRSPESRRDPRIFVPYPSSTR